MVLIQLKAPFVSVIVTVLSTLAELALLSFLLVLNNLHECKRLRSGRGVEVRHHLKRTRIISLLALAAFFVLEVVFSFYNDPVNNVVSETHACVRVANSVRERGDSRGFLRAADVLLECGVVENGTITQFEGNFSRQTQQVECSPQAMFTYPLDDRTVNDSVSDLPFRCVAVAEGEECVFLQQRGNLSLISQPFFLEDLPFLPENFPFLPTELHFTAPSNLTLFADRAIEAFQRNIFGPAALRRIIYSGASEGTCTFPVVDGTATTIPLAMIIALSVVWAIAILLFLSVWWLRKDVFFEMNNPMDWATRSMRSADDPLGMNPILTGVEDEERMLVKISTSARLSGDNRMDK
ncbi:hypothetical protein FGB62_20g28 [Gracilaria domingensis]|nr:hypothetical protein FGB62_20g28 [Gracilaria domingensis]